jgi:hypothetical protein
MRTLVIGIPLPNASFDNYSFASAPSISEYRRLVVEMSAVSRVVDEITNATAEHRTFGGQLLVNGPAADNRFALADLLAMRGREAGQFFARGGTMVCYAYPDATILGVNGLPEWHSYDWLPASERFDYRASLLPGFGKDAAQPLELDHPFAPYCREFAAASRYRAHVEDSAISAAGGAVLARSAGGFAVAFDLPVATGTIVFIPPLLDPAKDRQQIADAFSSAFDAIEPTGQTTEQTTQTIEAPDWIPKEVP